MICTHLRNISSSVAILFLFSCADKGTSPEVGPGSSSMYGASSTDAPISSEIFGSSSILPSSGNIPGSSGTAFSSQSLSSSSRNTSGSSSSIFIIPLSSSNPISSHIVSSSAGHASSGSNPAFGTHLGSMIFTPANLWADTTETTQAQYSTLMGTNPSFFNLTLCPTCPVENITAFEAMLYANARTKSELGSLDTVYQYSSITWGAPGSTSAQTKTTEVKDLVGLVIRPGAKGFRLPTEEEWKTLQKGTSTLSGVYWKALYPGDYPAAQSNAGLYAWYSGNANGTPQPVAQKIPNGFGLYDICGNVEEFTHTLYQGSYVSKGTGADATLGALMLLMVAPEQWLTGVRLVRDP